VRAAWITAPGAAEAIQVGDLPAPRPGPTDVLVRVEVVAVDQVDTYVRSGRWATPLPMPFVVGRDLVGTVADAPATSGFEPGQRVWCNSLGHGGRQGATAELAVVPAERLYALPAGVDAVEAVASFHPAATAWIGLHRRAVVEAGEVVLVGGAAGSVGTCATVLATAAGAHVIATARPADHERCRAAGARAVVDHSAPDLVAQVLAAAPGGVQLHWDTSGRADVALVPDLLAPGGRALVTAGRDAPGPPALWPWYTRDLRLIGFVISLASAPELAEAAVAINRQLAAGGFGVEVQAVLDLDDIVEAHRRVEAGGRGRVVVRVADPPSPAKT
jgi:NADPH:quinone reductase-like Zn-dependent oxidoreductase